MVNAALTHSKRQSSQPEIAAPVAALRQVGGKSPQTGPFTFEPVAEP
jgi:hypothetical protein